MQNVLYIVFWISLFIIYWANVGYPLSIIILGKILKRANKKVNNYEPTITVVIVAHNEEEVIKDKLENTIKLDYPKNKMTILIASDYSADKTDKIVNEFIKKHKEYNIILHKTKERIGKTSVQNEAIKLVNSELIVMTDANAILKKDAIRELVSSFDKDVAYVSGKLVYTNSLDNITSNMESTYWSLDTRIREIESNIQTITAGNGAIYACKADLYHEFKPIECHDSSMPVYFALKGKRAIANHKAIAYEKASDNVKDEFKRKVRMSRIVLRSILPSIKVLNVFKYRWFTYFYLGHRTARYLLWLSHIAMYITNIFLLDKSIVYVGLFVIQNIVYLLTILKKIFKINNKIFGFCYYYCMTILAQLIGVIKTIFGKNKAYWEQAKSTRSNKK